MNYYSQNGGVIFTTNQAKAMSADALNWAEYLTREYYKKNPNSTKSQLEAYWIQKTGETLKSTSYNQGMATKLLSMNPASPVPVIPYVAC